MSKNPFPPFDISSSAGLAELRLLHLADSALPIGALAHSFGLESLASHELLKVSELAAFLRGYLEEAGMVEAVFCREAFRLAGSHVVNSFRQGTASAVPRISRSSGVLTPEVDGPDAYVECKMRSSGNSQNFSPARWVELNDLLTARKPARESRAGSAHSHFRTP